jgi:hypothetical protein
LKLAAQAIADWKVTGSTKDWKQYVEEKINKGLHRNSEPVTSKWITRAVTNKELKSPERKRAVHHGKA